MNAAMTSRLSAVLLSLSLAACASHEGTTKPDAPRAEVRVAVASVQVQRDCPDPVEPHESPSQPAAAAMPPPANSVAAGPSAERGADTAFGWSPPCTQSTVQLLLTNVGPRDAQVRVEAVRLLDAANKRELGTMAPRKPTRFEAGTYQPWDERMPTGATVQAGYRLGDPDWGKVQSTVGPSVDLFARPFVLELDVSVDGISQTVRSPEFLREQEHLVVT
jgi:hypothetical protein